ncbi:MAG: hypothetical protein WD076_09760 [Parvularculaceae bacterium]
MDRKTNLTLIALYASKEAHGYCREETSHAKECRMSRVKAIIERVAPWALKGGILTSTGRFAILAILVICVVTAAIQFALRLEIFDAGAPVVAAILLGVAATILLGVGLMAAIFHSSRSGVDEEASRRADLDKQERD